MSPFSNSGPNDPASNNLIAILLSSCAKPSVFRRFRHGCTRCKPHHISTAIDSESRTIRSAARRPQPGHALNVRIER
jgi:hypothetical protein